MLRIDGKAKEELLNTKPYRYTYDSVAGGKDNHLSITAVCKDGSKVQLKVCGISEYADNSIVNQHFDCETVARQIAELGQVKGLLIDAEKYSSFENTYDFPIRQNEFDKGLPNIGNGQSYSAYCPLEPINWEQVGERLKKRLSEDPKSLRIAAAVLDIQLY